MLGSQLVQFALIWYITETTGLATALAMASLVGLLPKVILGPIIGAFVDRWNRKKILIFSDAAIAGPIADPIGVHFWFLIGGAVTAILGIFPFFVPAIMDIESAPFSV